MEKYICMIGITVNLALLGCVTNARGISHPEVINQGEAITQSELLYYHMSTALDPMGRVRIYDIQNGEQLHFISPWKGIGTHSTLISDDESVIFCIFPSGVSAVTYESEGELVVRLSRDGVMYGPELQLIGTEDEGVVAAFSDSKQGLLDIESGEWVLDPSDFIRVCSPNEGRVVAWDLEGRWAVYDYAGNKIGDFVSIPIDPLEQHPIFLSGVIAVSSGNTVTVLNRDGDIVAECAGRNAGYFHEGYARCDSVEPGKNHLSGYIDAEGEWVIEPLYRSAGHFSDGLAPVSFQSRLMVSHHGSFSSNVFPAPPESTDDHIDIDGLEERDDRWGFINTDGDLVIPMVFDEVRHFSEGLAAARSGELWGYIGIDGQWVLEPEFLQAYHFQGGYAVVRLDGEKGFVLIDQAGTVVVAP